MTKEGLEILLERVADWPDAAHDDLVKALSDIEAKHFGVYSLSDDERTSIRRGLADMRNSRIASDDAVAAVFNRYK